MFLLSFRKKHKPSVLPPENTSFDAFDILIAITSHLRAEGQNITSYPTQVEPLYNTSEQIIAYDVTMSDGTYLIVNANRDNPIIIEFGAGRPTVDQMVDGSTTNGLYSTKKYYVAPLTYLTKNTDTQQFHLTSDGTAITQETELNAVQTTFAKILNTPNETKAEQHRNIRNELEDYAASTLNSNTNYYDFLITESSLPQSSYYEKMIYGKNKSYRWGYMSEFQNLDNVDNHCAATSAFNMMVYYADRWHFNMDFSNNRIDIFKKIHSFMKNGPVSTSAYRSRIKKYAESLSLKTIIENIDDTWTNYQVEAINERMSLMRVWPALFHAHMINGIGYRIYDGDIHYCVVLNNWGTINYTIFGTNLFDLSRIYIYG